MPRKLQVTTGQRFGRLQVVDPEVRIPSQQKSRPGGWRAALCQCDCGSAKAIRLNHLLTGFIVSCGCLRDENRIRHGLHGHPLYQTWALMMNRCYNPASKDYPGWGARGVRVCPEWHNPAAFIAWIEANLGPRPGGKTPGGRPEYTLDREDTNGNYEPGNVRWASGFRQVMNSRHRLAQAREAEREELFRMVLALRSSGMSQQAIADRIGIGQTTVSKYLKVLGSK